MLIPAPVGTYVLHVIRHDNQLVILKHVCIAFDWNDQFLVPRCMIPADDNVLEAAVLHPTGEVSGSPRIGRTFNDVEQFRTFIGAFLTELTVKQPEPSEPSPAREPGKPRPGMKRRTPAEVKEDLAREQAANTASEPEDLIG